MKEIDKKMEQGEDLEHYHGSGPVRFFDRNPYWRISEFANRKSAEGKIGLASLIDTIAGVTLPGFLAYKGFNENNLRKQKGAPLLDPEEFRKHKIDSASLQAVQTLVYPALYIISK